VDDIPLTGAIGEEWRVDDEPQSRSDRGRDVDELREIQGVLPATKKREIDD
jgi:hypothetical protein